MFILCAVSSDYSHSYHLLLIGHIPMIKTNKRNEICHQTSYLIGWKVDASLFAYSLLIIYVCEQKSKSEQTFNESYIHFRTTPCYRYIIDK